MQEKSESNLNIAIIGLGLMGGSLAYALRGSRAFSGFRDASIIGYDASNEILSQALQYGAIDIAAASLSEAVADADLTIFCTFPDAIAADMQESADCFKDGAVISDICGVKGEIFKLIDALKPSGVEYISMHPMAGKECGGFANADGSLFKGAGFIITPPPDYSESALALIFDLCEYVGAGRICINEADEHDSIIGYTSDLMHIAATALCQDFPENMTMAHTAGAFRDCTRIAMIDAALWTDLLTKNAGHIIPHIDKLILALSGFSNALQNEDKAHIYSFLERACNNKKEMMSL